MSQNGAVKLSVSVKQEKKTQELWCVSLKRGRTWGVGDEGHTGELFEMQDPVCEPSEDDIRIHECIVFA